MTTTKERKDHGECFRCRGPLSYLDKAQHGMPKGWYCEVCGERQPTGRISK